MGPHERVTLACAVALLDLREDEINQPLDGRSSNDAIFGSDIQE